MDYKLERYEIRCIGNPDPVAKAIESIGGRLYEVSRSGLISATLSSKQRSKLGLEDKKLGITITP